MKENNGPSLEQVSGTELIDGARELGEAAEIILGRLPTLIKNHRQLLDYMKQEAEAGEQRVDFVYALGMLAGDIASIISVINGFRMDFEEFKKVFMTDVKVNEDVNLH